MGSFKAFQVKHAWNCSIDGHNRLASFNLDVKLINHGRTVAFFWCRLLAFTGLQVKWCPPVVFLLIIDGWLIALAFLRINVQNDWMVDVFDLFKDINHRL